MEYFILISVIAAVVSVLVILTTLLCCKKFINHIILMKSILYGFLAILALSLSILSQFTQAEIMIKVIEAIK